MTNCSTSRTILKLVYGLLFVVAGADKFFMLIDDWGRYLSLCVSNNLPAVLSGYNFLYLVGIVELAIGLAILTKWTKQGAYAAMVTLLLIAANLFTMCGWQVLAIHDIMLALGALALAQLED